jgi:hypothetical protein
MTTVVSLRRLLAAATLSLLATPAFAEGPSPVVVELFTSQGCSSCPPADAYLAELAKRPGLLPLSLNVDYWDYQGWQDTLGRQENSLRQKAYQQRKGKMEVFTPQVVIDGAVDMPGSPNRYPEIEAAITARQQAAAARPVVSARIDGESVIIDVPADSTGKPHNATVWFIRKLSSVAVDVGGGENAGKQMTYVNVVREMAPIGMWKGEAMSLTVPRQDATAKSHDGYAVLLQEDGEGEILCATALTDPAPPGASN